MTCDETVQKLSLLGGKSVGAFNTHFILSSRKKNRN